MALRKLVLALKSNAYRRLTTSLELRAAAADNLVAAREAIDDLRHKLFAASDRIFKYISWFGALVILDGLWRASEFGVFLVLKVIASITFSMSFSVDCTAVVIKSFVRSDTPPERLIVFRIFLVCLIGAVVIIQGPHLVTATLTKALNSKIIPVEASK